MGMCLRILLLLGSCWLVSGKVLVLEVLAVWTRVAGFQLDSDFVFRFPGPANVSFQLTSSLFWKRLFPVNSAHKSSCRFRFWTGCGVWFWFWLDSGVSVDYLEQRGNVGNNNRSY